MRLSDFDYHLPPELIAQAPLAERDASRLLVVDRASGTLTHRTFRELPSLLSANDLVVVNDTRVVPARLLGRREGGTGEVEIFLTHPVRDPSLDTALDPLVDTEGIVYEALVRPARKLPQGTMVRVGSSGIPVEILEELDEKRRRVRFPPGFRVGEFLEREGHVPLPPYIRRTDGPEDRDRYQTVYAREAGAVAAPTAGLHFTPALLGALGERGIETARITLHVGPGTFTPVTEADPREHVMERESYRIGPEAAAAIAKVRAREGRVVAVGTTVVRTLESAAVANPGEAIAAAGNANGVVHPGEGWTRMFICPPYTFRVVDALITNFHLPRSTLLMLVSAFGGTELLREAYREAVANRYRFYSYGDAMLIQ